MTFTQEGREFRLAFEHKITPKWREWKTTIKVGGKPISTRLVEETSRSETKAILYSCTGTVNERKVWTEVSHATCRHYFKDRENKEIARKSSLRALTPFIRKSLREPMWQAYLKRGEEE